MTLPGSGSIEVICGSMFSGKSEELIRRVTRAKIARRRVQVFKPKLDDRFSEVEVVSHTGMRLTALAVATSAEVLARTDDRTEVVGIDEAQFSGKQLQRSGEVVGPVREQLAVEAVVQDADRLDAIGATLERHTVTLED